MLSVSSTFLFLASVNCSGLSSHVAYIIVTNIIYEVRSLSSVFELSVFTPRSFALLHTDRIIQFYDYVQTAVSWICAERILYFHLSSIMMDYLSDSISSGLIYIVYTIVVSRHKDYSVVDTNLLDSNTSVHTKDN